MSQPLTAPVEEDHTATLERMRRQQAGNQDGWFDGVTFATGGVFAERHTNPYGTVTP
jgi:hypothetical protein